VVQNFSTTLRDESDSQSLTRMKICCHFYGKFFAKYTSIVVFCHRRVGDSALTNVKIGERCLKYFGLKDKAGVRGRSPHPPEAIGGMGALPGEFYDYIFEIMQF